jgi:cytoskeletal protein CcmA (bactofilin family)
MAGLSGVVYVKGDVKISGNYTGNFLIVATGSISITGDVTANSLATDSLALLSAKSIKIAGNPTIHGLIYGHSVITDVQTTVSGNATIYGAICSDVVRTNGGITVHYRDVWKGLPLPGTGKTQWAPVSWQQLNVPSYDEG